MSMQNAAVAVRSQNELSALPYRRDAERGDLSFVKWLGIEFSFRSYQP